MDVLVDYDNVLRADRRQGLAYVAERILAALPAQYLPDGGRAHLRLYGGWYEGRVLTQLAQTLAAEVARDFPRPIVLDPAVPRRLHVSAEMAYALYALPTRHLFDTVRTYDPPEGIRCRNPRSRGCAIVPCLLEPLQRFLEDERCPADTCTLTPRMLLYRRQQKLVDTMLAVDLVGLTRERAPIAVVSSDSDLVPAFVATTLEGVDVVQVHTRGRARTPDHYPLAHTGRFIQVAI